MVGKFKPKSSLLEYNEIDRELNSSIFFCKSEIIHIFAKEKGDFTTLSGTKTTIQKGISALTEMPFLSKEQK